MLDLKSLNIIVKKLCKKHGVINHAIDSFNLCLSKGIPQIIVSLFKAEAVIQPDNQPEISSIYAVATFSNVNMIKPERMGSDGKTRKLYPNEARMYGYNYNILITADITVTATAYYTNGNTNVREYTAQKVSLAYLPIIVGSNACHLCGLSSQELIALNEDPTDPFGYFIVGGQEWINSILETLPYNFVNIHRNVGHKDERTRLEIISKPGDAYENSSEMMIIYTVNNNIYIKLSSPPNIKNVKFPFYIILRLLGANTDIEILRHIIGAEDMNNLGLLEKSLYDILYGAFESPYPEFSGIRRHLSNANIFANVCRILAGLQAKREGKEDQVHNYNVVYVNNLYSIIDKFILPHLGSTESRYTKMRYICYYIRRVILTFMNVQSSTSRDDYHNKRVLTAGETFSKMIKTLLHKTVINKIVQNLKDKFTRVNFDSVRLETLMSGINPADFENQANKQINTGEKEVSSYSNDKHPKNFRTMRVERKNHINMLAANSNIAVRRTSAQRQDVRSYDMRSIHPSQNGKIGCVQSADTGPRVGLNKPKSVSAKISQAQNSDLLKIYLLEDPLIIPFSGVSPLNVYKYTRILVNGYILGCTKEPAYLYQKYRELKRGWNIDTLERATDLPFDNTTTIYWNMQLDELHFWIDTGRILEPVPVIRNNSDEDPIGQKFFGSKYDIKNNTGFFQGVLLTRQHLDDLYWDKLDVDALFSDGILEWVSSGEMYYSVYCPTPEKLYENENNPLLRYDYLQISISLLGLPGLGTPYGNVNNISRDIFASNQIKQANSINSSYPFRMDKKSYVQTFNEMPLVKTFTNDFTAPFGFNSMVAILCYNNNQEDSLIFNSSASKRGLFGATHFSVISEKHDGRETIMKPDASDIQNSKLNFSKLNDNGFISTGVEVESGDVLVGIVRKDELGAVITGGSIYYKEREPAMILQVLGNVEVQETKKYHRITKVKYCTNLQVGEGDKFSSRHGQKGVVSELDDEIDLPFNSSGLSPDIIVSSHAFPSRMTIGQLLEGTVSRLCAEEGTIRDGTIFTPVDIDDTLEKLEKYIFNKYSYDQMFDGVSGLWIENDIFFCPTYYMRLQKYADAELNAIENAKISYTTRQPISGYKKGGSGRISELSKDTLVAQGATGFLMEKFREDSDLYDIYLCATCGNMLVHNYQSGYNTCNVCSKAKRLSVPTVVKSTWTSKLFLHTINCIGVNTQLITESSRYDPSEHIRVDSNSSE